MKNILVPTDFSDAANRAADIAIAIAAKSGAKIHFLHLQLTPVPWVKLDKEKEKRFPETLKEIGHANYLLNNLVQKAEKKGLTAEHFLVFDVGREEILKHVPAHHHDFIVMGSRGASGFKELFIGSNAQKVLREANVPVLVVKEKAKWPIDNIVFASDFEQDVHRAFGTVVELADLHQSHIHLLYVNAPFAFEETDRTLQKMYAFLETCPRGGSCSIHIYNSLNEENGILKFSQSMPADLIALTTHGRKGFFNLTDKSITESVVNHAQIPVLSMNLH